MWNNPVSQIPPSLSSSVAADSLNGWLRLGLVTRLPGAMTFMSRTMD
jgi:hypothetical protein